MSRVLGNEGPTAMTDDKCEACETDPEWVWFDGRWAHGQKCTACMRGKLPPRRKFPEHKEEKTTEENVTTIGKGGRTRVIPAGARPIGEVYPTVRTKEALDEVISE